MFSNLTWRVQRMLVCLINSFDQALPWRAHCGHWIAKKNRRQMRHSVYGWVYICPRCYEREHRWNKGEQ